MTAATTGRQIHNVAPEEAYDLLRTRATGLTDGEVVARRVELGPNEIETAAPIRWPRMLLRHFFNFFSLLLDASAALCFVAEWLRPGEDMALLGAALLGVSLLNGAFAFFQEYRAERAMEALRRFLPRQVSARRAGQWTTIFASELVPGDLIRVGEGDQIPADARIVHCESLTLNNSPLTGESRAIPATADAVASSSLLDSRNVAFAGCSVLRGTGECIVFGTGRRTEFGKIASLSQHMSRPPSPLERQVARMTRLLTVIAAAMGTAFFVYGVVSGRPLIQNVVFMMGIIVANVPEGLLPTLTLALSMASLRMTRKQVLVKSLEAVEALGAMHVICTDKTGTLTRNELAVARAASAIDGESLSASAAEELLRVALIASDVRRLTTGQLIGDPLDVAVATRYGELGGDASLVMAETRRHFPFDVHKRRQAGIGRVDASDAGLVFACKGAWEALRPLVSRVALRAPPDEGDGVRGRAARDGAKRDTERDEPRVIAPYEQPADPLLLDQIDATERRLASDGYRVLAVAMRRLGDTSNDDAQSASTGFEHELTLLGFLLLDDPIRPEVPAAIARCRRAGIRVLIITGDHPDTALAVARRIGLAGDDAREKDRSEALVLRGDELERMREDRLIERLRGGLTVFARTTPEQKMKIVLALKRTGEVVGMTGDGVNDAPALKAADVGIAMGVGGTDVARESADIILLDNNFASIVAGIEEGRAIFRNIQRFTDYVLASNVPEIVPFLVYLLFPVPLALTVIQILSIDLGTDLLPAIALGQEPPEADVMDRPPRRAEQSLLSRGLLAHAYLFFGPLEALASLALFFAFLWSQGWRYGEPLALSDPLYRSATGLTLASVVFMQMGNLIGRRAVWRSGLDAGLFGNRLLMAGIALEALFAWALLAWPPLQRVLGTGPVPWPFVAVALAMAPAVFAIDYVRKRINNALETRANAAPVPNAANGPYES